MLVDSSHFADRHRVAGQRARGSVRRCKGSLKNETGSVRIRHSSSHDFATHASRVILWIELGGKPKWLPLNSGYHDVMCTIPISAAAYYSNHGKYLFDSAIFEYSRIFEQFVLTLEIIYRCQQISMNEKRSNQQPVPDQRRTIRC